MISATSNVNREPKLGAVNKPLPAAKTENIQFDSDETSIKKESFAELNQVAQGIIENKQSIFLGGHADAVRV